MKKKLFALTILPFLLTGCSFLDGLFDSGESYTYTSKNTSESSVVDSSIDSTSKSNNTTSNTTAPHIVFDSEGFTYEESTGNYLITMKRGSSITLNAVIANGDASEFSLIYSWARGGEYGTINNNTVRINDGGHLLHSFMHECGHIIDQVEIGCGFEHFNNSDENIKNPYDKTEKRFFG